VADVPAVRWSISSIVPRVLFVPAPTISPRPRLPAHRVAGLDDVPALGGRQRGRLPGRTESNEAGGAVDQEPARELLERSDVDLALRVERCHDRHPQAAQIDGFEAPHDDTMTDGNQNEQF